jgi:hypothetical protein
MANESMNQLIFTEETLKQFIEDCHKEYKLEGGCYLFEDAHSPIPKPLGGTEIASLTRKHHCIHDVMQSEVYQCKCFFNDAKQYLVEEWQFLRPIYNKWVNDHNKKVNDKLHEKKNDEGKSIHAIKMAEVSHSERDGEGKSVSAVRKAKKLHEERNEEGKSVHALEMSKKLHEEKDEDGKSAFAVKNSKKQHEEMKEQDPEAYHEFQRNAALKGGSKKILCVP